MISAQYSIQYIIQVAIFSAAVVREPHRVNNLVISRCIKRVITYFSCCISPRQVAHCPSEKLRVKCGFIFECDDSSGHRWSFNTTRSQEDLKDSKSLSYPPPTIANKSSMFVLLLCVTSHMFYPLPRKIPQTPQTVSSQPQPKRRGRLCAYGYASVTRQSVLIFLSSLGCRPPREVLANVRSALFFS